MTETQPHLKNAFFFFKHYSDGIWAIVTSKITINSIVCFNRSFRLTMKYMKYIMALSLTLCEGNAPVTSGLPPQRDSNVECISISCHHHTFLKNVRHYILFSINLMQIVWHFPTYGWHMRLPCIFHKHGHSQATLRLSDAYNMRQ